MRCINKSNPEYKELLKNSGLNPIVLNAKIMVYQDKNNTDKFPTLDELKKSTTIQSENLDDILLQIEQNKTKEQPNAEIEKTINKWLKTVGIKYKSTDKIYDTEGNEINAVAKADILHKVIEVIENKRDITTLPEEAGHMLVRMLGLEHPLVKAMMKDIDKFQVYQDVINSTYGELYKHDEAKLREEAVGKMISQIIVAQATNKALPKTMDRQVSRWQLAWKWIKTRLQRLIGTEAKDELKSFIDAANIITNNENIETSEEWEKASTSSKTVFYEMNEEEVNKVITKLDSIPIHLDVKINKYVTKMGKIVSNRVTQLVKKINDKRFRNKGNQPLSDRVKLSSVGGTVVHSYLQHITVTILNKVNNNLDYIDKTKITQKEIENTVKEELKDNEDIKERGIDFVKIDKTTFKELEDDVRARLHRIKDTQDLINKETKTKGKAKIYPELTIYDPKKDLAGTIDLLVVYSNGKASIYDYKTKTFKRKSGVVMEESFSIDKIRVGEDQMSIYTQMLREEYGINEFVETRLIPIDMRFTKTKHIAMARIGVKDERTYLEEIPVVNELTGIQNIDEQLTKMFQLKEQLRRKLDEDYRDLTTRLKLENVIRNIRKLQVNKDTRYIYREINNMVIDFNKRITRLNDNPQGINHEYLNDLIDHLTVYKDFFRYAKDIELEKVTDEELKQKITTKYEHLFTQIATAIDTATKKSKELLESNNNVDFNTPVKEISGIGAMFRTLSQFSRGHFKALYNIINFRAKYVRDKVDEVYILLKTQRERLKDWADINGISLQKAINLLIDEKGNLVSKWNGTYSKEREQARKNKDINWFLENTNIIKTKNGLDYADEKSRKKFDDLRNDAIKRINKYTGDEYATYRETQINNWDDKHNIRKNSDALFNSPYYIIAKENDRFLSDRYKYMLLPENKSLLDTYNMFIRLNELYAKITGKDIRQNFIPEIQQSMATSLANWDIGIKAMRNNIRKSFNVRQESELMGVRDVNTNEIVPKIPLLYRSNLNIKLSARELNKIKDELFEKGINEEDENYKEELEALIQQKEREKGLEIKSRDLFTSAIMFAETAYTYEYTKDVEAEIKAIKLDLEKNTQTKITDTSNNVLLEKITGKVSKMIGAPKSELDAMDKFIKLYVYGQNIQNKDLTSKKGVSLNKSIYQAMKYTSAKALGLSWLTATGNAVGVGVNTIMLAAEEKYFTRKQIYNGLKMILSNDKKTQTLLKLFAPYEREITTKMQHKLSTTKLSRVFNEELLYLLMKFPDKGVDILTTLGVLQNWGLDKEGNIRRIGKGIKPLIDTITIKNGKIEGLTDNQYIKLRKLMTTASYKIKGNMIESDKNLIGTNMFIRIFMQFRNWIPGLLTNRFEGLKYNDEFGDLDVGRFNVLFGEFTKKGLLPKLNTFANLLFETTSFGLYKGFSRNGNTELAQKYYDKLLKENPELKGKITIDQLIELRKQKLKGMATELQLLMGMYLLVALASATVPDDDKDKYKKFLAMNSYRTINRGLLELTFFFDPRSISYIIEKPMPLWRNVKDMQNVISSGVDKIRDTMMDNNYKGVFSWERDYKKNDNNFYKYVSKIVPSRALTDIFDFFDTFDKQKNSKYHL